MPKEWYSWVPCARQPGSTSRRSAFPPRRLGIPRWGPNLLSWSGLAPAGAHGPHVGI